MDFNHLNLKNQNSGINPGLSIVHYQLSTVNTPPPVRLFSTLRLRNKPYEPDPI